MALLTVGPTFDQDKQNFVVNIGDSEIWLFDDVSEIILANKICVI